MASSRIGRFGASLLVGLLLSAGLAPSAVGAAPPEPTRASIAAVDPTPNPSSPFSAAGIPITADRPVGPKSGHSLDSGDASPALAGYSIQGTVTQAGVGPLSGIYVEADSPTSGAYYTAATASNGTYSIDGLPSDTYYIWFGDPAGAHFNGWYGDGGVPVSVHSATSVLISTASAANINAQLAPIAPWIVTLQASATSVAVGSAVVLTATTNQNIALTNYDVSIVRDDGSGWYCEVGTVCYTDDSMSTAGSITYQAFVALPDGTSIQAASSPVTVTWGSSTRSTYHAVTPTRILDTRTGLGISSALMSHHAQSFQVTGDHVVNGVDLYIPTSATAVTGNLTVTQQTKNGFLFIGPTATDNPTSSTLNFPSGDDRANAVTVALSGAGTLSVTYAAPVYGPTAQAIFDITGYFTPDTSGATYHALSPTRLLDSRDGTGGLPGPFVSHVARVFQASGGGSVVPANAIAVTGNLTVTQQASNGFLYIGPAPANNPTSSTLNFPAGDDRANAVTVQIGTGGTLSITFAASAYGPTAHVIFDVTGYFTPDSSGAGFVPLNPKRLLDSRDGTGGLSYFRSHVAQSFPVSGGGSTVPGNAVAVTGNLTVTQQGSTGFLYVGPYPQNNPTSSTLNFPFGDDRANAVDVALGSGGRLSVTYAAPTLAPTAHAIFDVTGYFAPLGSSLATLELTPTLGETTAGASLGYAATLDGASATGDTVLSIAAGPGGVRSTSTTYSAGSAVPGASCSASACSATLSGLYAVTGTDGAVISPTVLLWVGPAVAASLTVTGLAATVATGTADNGMVVTAYDAHGNIATDFNGLVAFASSDPLALLPQSYTFTSIDGGSHRFTAPTGVMFSTPGTQSVSAFSSLDYPILTGIQSGIVVTGTPNSSTFFPFTPTRLLDTRTGNGLAGNLSAQVARTFQVAGRGGIPGNAVAVTGNLTVTSQTQAGYLYIGAVATNSPAVSSLRFGLVDTRSNAVATSLGASGTLSVTYVASPGSTTEAIFDATGYFTVDASGSIYHPVAPTAVLDSRNGVGLSGAFMSYAPRSFPVAGLAGVPSGVVGVTGHLAVTQQTMSGFVFVGPTPVTYPTSSTFSFPVGEARGSAAAVALGAGGTLSVTYCPQTLGGTAQFVFIVTGYFAP